MLTLTQQQSNLLETALYAANTGLRAQVHTSLDRQKDGYTETPAQDGDKNMTVQIIPNFDAMLKLKIDQLHVIEDPKEPVNHDSFGECNDCGNDIDHNRLLVFPTAKRCAVCEASYEHIYSPVRRYVTL